jgi:hypothetical protein
MRRSSALPARLLALLIVVVVSTGLLATGPAQAVVATPVSPVFGASIDPYSGYERENTCSPTAKPGTVAWRDLLVRTYGTRWNNITRACTASDSGHEEGRALDWRTLATDATQKAQGDALLAWLLATDKYGNPNANARRLGMQYIQFNNRMWRAYNPTAGWLPQMETVNGVKTDCAKLGSTYVTTCHRDHIHFSMSWNGANKKTSWFTASNFCPTPATPPAFTSPMPTAMTSVPLTPARILNTALGTGACRLAPGGRLDLTVTGVGGVPATGVGAVALNVVAYRPAGSSTYLSVFPTGAPPHYAYSVSVPSGGEAASMVTVPVGSNGKVSIRNSSAPVDVIVDVEGYFTTAATGSTFTNLAGQRALDTRATAATTAGQRLVVPIAGHYGVPVGAAGVLVNLTSTGSAAAGYLAVAPDFGTTGGASVVRYSIGDTAANRAMSALATDGSLQIYTSSPTHVVVDVVGWFGTGGQGLHFNALSPARVLDTRVDAGGVPTVVAGSPATVPLAGQGGVAADAVSVLANLTVLWPTEPTYSTMWPTGASQPVREDLPLPAGAMRTTLVSPGLTGGAASLAVHDGSADAVLEVLGYFR